MESTISLRSTIATTSSNRNTPTSSCSVMSGAVVHPDEVPGDEQVGLFIDDALRRMDRRHVLESPGLQTGLLGQLTPGRLLDRFAGVRRSRRHLPGRAAGDVTELPDERDVIVVEERQHADRTGRRHDAVDALVAVGEAHHILPDVDPRVPVHLPGRQLHDGRWLGSRLGLPVSVTASLHLTTPTPR